MAWSESPCLGDFGGQACLLAAVNLPDHRRQLGIGGRVSPVPCKPLPRPLLFRDFPDEAG